METGIFAAGCFWKPDLEFEKLKGVEKTEVGYCGGNNPIQPTKMSVLGQPIMQK